MLEPIYICLFCIFVFSRLALYLSREHWHHVGPVRDLLFITEDCYISVGADGVLVHRSLNSHDKSFVSLVPTCINRITQSPNNANFFAVECGNFVDIVHAVTPNSMKNRREIIYYGFGFQQSKQLALCPINCTIAVATYVSFACSLFLSFI
jgi:hypothetical protein